MKVSTCFTIVLAAVGLFAGGCASSPQTTADQNALKARSTGALEEMKAKDPNLNGFLNGAYGYAIFPSIGKGAFVVGGGYGQGEVYEQGQFIGYADMSQATVGLQAGGQTFSELIVFQNKNALDRFKYGKTKFEASASAVALKAGASAAANYSDGVAVFTLPQGGLMFEAAIGGQEFGFVPADSIQRHDVASSNSNDVWNWTSGSNNANTASGTIKAQNSPSYNNNDNAPRSGAVSNDFSSSDVRVAPSTRPAEVLPPTTQPLRLE